MQSDSVYEAVHGGEERHAAYYLTGVLVALALGRFVSTPLMKYVSPSRMLGVYGVVNVLLMAVTMTQPGIVGAWGVVASGFFLSIMFPTIFALGLKGLGPNTKLAGSLLVMAIVGGALFPLVLGFIARTDGESGEGIYRAAAWVCSGGVVWVSGAADSADEDLAEAPRGDLI